MLLGNGEMLPNTKLFSLLLWLVPAINQNAEEQLALCWHYSHTTVYTGSQPRDVKPTVLSCQVHLLLSLVEIHPLVVQACENRSAGPVYRPCCIINDGLCKFTAVTCGGKAQETIHPQMITAHRLRELTGNALQVKHTVACPPFSLHSIGNHLLKAIAHTSITTEINNTHPV